MGFVSCPGYDDVVVDVNNNSTGLLKSFLTYFVNRLNVSINENISYLKVGPK